MTKRTKKIAEEAISALNETIESEELNVMGYISGWSS